MKRFASAVPARSSAPEPPKIVENDDSLPRQSAAVATVPSANS